ncbi:MAG: right-handed parallel beta-helix repeat-containing protein, partial [Deltaproteobacteria bacterium]|nr:right-handed parallel beta-helix repeat-containing protein [Deltaproteobacteria bacterium]
LPLSRRLCLSLRLALRLALSRRLCLALSLSLPLPLSLVPACAAPSAAPPTADAAPADAAATACSPAQRKPGGGCCAAGQFFDADTSTCASVGPAVCAAVLPDDPRACVPRWCADWRDAAGAACDPKADGCVAEGRACTADENAKGAGCPAGQWPVPDGACVAAGPAAALAHPGKLDAVFAGIDPPQALPLAAETSFCPDGPDGALALCPAGVAAPGCKVGEMPDPAKAGACLAVGVPWTCPPGFVDGGAGCAPDPADCGDGPFGAIEAEPGVVFVDPNAAAGGDGSPSKPLQTVQQAAPILPAGGTLALAKGTYVGSLTFGVPLKVRGRCAALVTISAPAGTPVVRIKGSKADGEVLVEGATLTGSTLGMAVDGALSGRGRRLFIHKAFGVGAIATGAAASLALENCVIANTKPDGAKQGYGALASGGAMLALTDVRITGNRNHGIQAVTAGTRLALERVWVDGTTPGGAGQVDGIGLFIDSAAEVVGRSVRVSGSVGVGIRFSNGQGTASFTGLVVVGTQPDGNGENGIGVRLKDGPSLALTGARLSGNRFAGANIAGAVQLAANGLVIDDTQASGGATSGVAGLQIGWGAKATLRGVRLSGNRDNGLLVTEKAAVAVDRLVVDDTRPRVAGGAFGYGVSVQTGASVTLRGARVTAAKGLGVRVGDAGSRLLANNLAIDDIAVREKDGVLGHGLAVLVGAQADVRGLRVANCVDNAIQLVGQGTRARLAGVAVTGTTVNPKVKEPWIFAIAALSGARLDLAGAALPDQLGTGVYGAGPDASVLRLAGLDYQGAAQTASVFAVGVQADEGLAELAVAGSRFRGARAVGIAIAGAPTDLRDVVLLDTAAGEHQPLNEKGDPSGPKVSLSDGVVVRGTAKFALRCAVVYGQVRAGVFLDGALTAQLAHVLVGGGYFGEVFNGKPTVERTAVLLQKNSQNQSSDAGLALPKPPKLVPVGDL